MKNLKDICKEISSAMRDAIIDTLSFNVYRVENEYLCGDSLNEHYVYKEFVYGEAIVSIEMGYETVNGCLAPLKEVKVLHDDDTHQSPLLEIAITEALPDWDKLEKEYGYVEQEESCFSYYL